MIKRYDTNLYGRFIWWAEQRPHDVALKYIDGRRVNFSELACMVVASAGRLQDLGIGRSDVIGLFHDKEPETFALMLACLGIGTICVNLDEGNPSERISCILDTCRPVRVFYGTEPKSSASIACARSGVPLTHLVTLELGTAEHKLAPFVPAGVIGSDIAYIMFTSGSTGNPKGVAISHAQVLNFIDWAAVEFAIGSGDTLTNANPMYFDNSVFDFYASIFNGAALTALPASLVQDPCRLVGAVADTGCTHWFSVPSLLIYLTTMHMLNENSWPTIHTIIFGGEGYPIPELRKLYDLFGGRARLVNVYGPTECTCICSAHEITPAILEKPSGLPPIGHLAPNFRGYLLEEDLEVSIGEIGELCLVGPNVGLGYFRDPKRTAEAFTMNPLCHTHAEQIYRTGDFMRMDPADGLLYFVGRKDQQFKHMGYRIESGEIEAAINRLEGIERSVVLYKRHRQCFGEIIAFVGTRDNHWTEDGVKEALRQNLPSYMIPHRVALMASLPHNASGKIDRKRLFEEA